MKHVVLIACCKRKLTRVAPAELLYQGDLFRKSLTYARALRSDDIYVLSAKHGVIRLEKTIAPYEQTLNRMSAAARRTWASRVITQLAQVADLQADQFTLLASKRYREGILPHIRHASIPMEGLRIGRQLQWLKQKIAELNEA